MFTERRRAAGWRAPVDAEVRSAPIVDDGSVGALSPSAALPYGRAGSGVVTHARHVVLVGGRTIDAGLVDVADVIVGEVSDGGTIAAWADMPPIPEPSSTSRR